MHLLWSNINTYDLHVDNWIFSKHAASILGVES